MKTTINLVSIDKCITEYLIRLPLIADTIKIQIVKGLLNDGEF